MFGTVTSSYGCSGAATASSYSMTAGSTPLEVNIPKPGNRRSFTRWGKLDDTDNVVIHNSTRSFVNELKMLTNRAANAVEDDEPQSRWGPEDDKPFLPPPYVDLPPGLTPAQMDQFLREQRHDELAAKIAAGDLEFGDPDIRPPSPPPVYDKNGSRVNTRDVRVKEQMHAEYNRLVEYLLKHLPGFVASADYKPLKKVRKIIIPLDKYPEYNFMGLVIGPRGCNHKRLEAESGAQISLRGRGTMKECKARDHQTDEDAAMPMHVHISSDREECVEKAVALIEPLLDPFHPKHEEYKRRGLEQLALVNGVALGIVDVSKCSICGQQGHRAHECIEGPTFYGYKRAQVKCQICGDMGHITMDCKFAKTTGNTVAAHFAASNMQAPNIDAEYKKMLNEIDPDLQGLQDYVEQPIQTNQQLQDYQMAYYKQQYQQQQQLQQQNGQVQYQQNYYPEHYQQNYYGCYNQASDNYTGANYVQAQYYQAYNAADYYDQAQPVEPTEPSEEPPLPPEEPPLPPL